MLAPPPAANSSSATCGRAAPAARRGRGPARAARCIARSTTAAARLWPGPVRLDPLAALELLALEPRRDRVELLVASRRSRARRGRTAAGRRGSRGPSPRTGRARRSPSSSCRRAPGRTRCSASSACPSAPRRARSRRPEPLGRLDRELGTEQRDTVVVVRDHHVADAVARSSGSSACHSPMSLNTPDDEPVDVGPVVVEHLLLPLAEVRGADPDRVVDAGVDEPLRAPVDERVLARPRAEALAEQHELRPLRPRGAAASRAWSASSSMRAWRRPSLTRSSDSTDGRAAYCIATVAQSPRASSSSARHRGVVHVAGAGRRRDEQPRALERAGALELVNDGATRRRFVGRALEAGVDADRRRTVGSPRPRRSSPGRRRSTRSDGPARQRGERDVARDAPETSGLGGGMSNAASTDVSSSRCRANACSTSTRRRARRTARAPRRGRAGARPPADGEHPAPRTRRSRSASTRSRERETADVPRGDRDAERERLRRRGARAVGRQVLRRRRAASAARGRAFGSRPARPRPGRRRAARRFGRPSTPTRLLQPADDRARCARHREPEARRARTRPRRAARGGVAGTPLDRDAGADRRGVERDRARPQRALSAARDPCLPRSDERGGLDRLLHQRDERVVRRDREPGDDRLVRRRAGHQRALERQRHVGRRHEQPGLVGPVAEVAREADPRQRPTPSSPLSTSGTTDRPHRVSPDRSNLRWNPRSESG